MDFYAMDKAELDRLIPQFLDRAVEHAEDIEVLTRRGYPPHVAPGPGCLNRIQLEGLRRVSCDHYVGAVMARLLRFPSQSAQA